jgi:Arc/MetJ-type ribon-helix-helix transcriptional regulator
MPRALDPSLARFAGLPAAPPAQTTLSHEEPETVPTETRLPTRARVKQSKAARPRREASSKPAVGSPRSEPIGGRLRPVSAALTPDQRGWLYDIVGQASRTRRRTSHSELVRLAMERQWQQDLKTVVAAATAEAAAPASGEAGSFALAEEHLAWLRQVRGQALLQGSDLSQSDVVRAAVQAMIGTEWKALRADLDARARSRVRARAEGGGEDTP